MKEQKDFLRTQSKINETLEAHFKSVDEAFVVYGCQVSGYYSPGYYTIAPGLVFIDGKMRPFAGDNNVPDLPAYLTAKEETEQGQGEDAESTSTIYGVTLSKRSPIRRMAYIILGPRSAADYFTAVDKADRRKADKISVSERAKQFLRAVGDSDVLSYLLLANLTCDQLEAWLSNEHNQVKFAQVIDIPNALLIAIIGNPPICNTLANSARAMQLIVKSSVALEVVTRFNIAMNAVASSSIARDLIMNSPTAMQAVEASSMAIAKLAIGSAGLDPVSYPDMYAVADCGPAMNALVAREPIREMLRKSPRAMVAIGASSTAIGKMVAALLGLSPSNYSKIFDLISPYGRIDTLKAIASSALALNAILKSEVAAQAIEYRIQDYRPTIQDTLNAAPASLFTRQTEVRVGEGDGYWNVGAKTQAMYIPVGCFDNKATDYSIRSLADSERIAFIYRGKAKVDKGIALRGVRVVGVGDSRGYVMFDVYTAM